MSDAGYGSDRSAGEKEGRRTGRELDAVRKPRLVRPRARDVAHRVAAAPDEQQRLVERLDEVDAVRVAYGAGGGDQTESGKRLRRTETWKKGEEKTKLPRMDRLNEPILSPDSESVPHCRTIADGSYVSMTWRITCGLASEERAGDEEWLHGQAQRRSCNFHR
jgi:hypothetical protein